MAITKTNPVYAHLAYRRSVVVQLMDELRENYLALSSESPKKEILCGDVYQEDAIVPSDEIQLVLNELEEEAQGLEFQMRKFTFTQEEVTHGLLSSAKKAENDGGSKPKGAKKGRPKGSGTSQRGGSA